MQKGKSKRKVRRVLCALTVVLALIIIWYGVGRASSPGRAVRLIDTGAANNHVSPRQSDSVGLVRVVAYNIAHGRGTGNSNWSDPEARDDRLHDIGALLRKLNADIVVLNEVDFSSIWSGHENQAALIAQEAGYRYRVELTNIDVSTPFAALRFGNAVLSRHPIREAELIELPGFAAWETILGGKKNAVACEVELPDGSRLCVVGAHYDTRGDEAIRIASARAVIESVKDKGVVTVLAGDLNSTPSALPGARVGVDGRSGVDILVEDGGFGRTTSDNETDGAEPTFPSWGPDRAIDWVLVSEAGSLKQIEVYDSDLSDHLPVVADIDISAGRGSPESVR